MSVDAESGLHRLGKKIEPVSERRQYIRLPIGPVEQCGKASQGRGCRDVMLARFLSDPRRLLGHANSARMAAPWESIAGTSPSESVRARSEIKLSGISGLA